jgi:transposase
MHEELFTLALNLQEPWKVTKIGFNKEERQLDLWIDFELGSKFECPECREKGRSVHDTSEKIWRHLNFFQNKTYLHCRVPRVACERCGIHQVRVPWAREQSGFTLLMDALILVMVQDMPVKRVAEIIEEHDTRIWRIIHHYVEEGRIREDFSKISSIGIDEKSCAKGHQYITVVADLDTSRVIHVCEGRSASAVNSFYLDFLQHQGAPGNVTSICCDMSPAYIRGISDNFPESAIILDKFHVMKIVNQAVDEVRRLEQGINRSLKRTRYIWLKNPKNLTIKQQDQLGSLKDMNLKTVRAYNIKLSLQIFWEIDSKEIAESYLKRWYFWATHSKLDPIVEVAKTLKRHWSGIMNYFSYPISNGILEALNGLIQSMKTAARGYRSMRNFVDMIYLRLGKLDFGLPT